MQNSDWVEKTRDFLDHLVTNGTIERIMLTWGEPLMSPNTFKLIDHFRGRAKLAVYTNGTLIKEAAPRLKDVEVKVSLHSIIWWGMKTNRYKEMVEELEKAGIRYGFIYMVTYENFHQIRETYFDLLSAWNFENFSMKFQPLYIPPDSDKNLKLRKRFALANMNDIDWEIFEKQILDLIRFERFMRNGESQVIYPFYENNHQYLVSLKAFYQTWAKIQQCDTAPIIVIGSDWLVHPCMFLFNQVVWNILAESEPWYVLKDLSESSVKSMKCAECFSEECLWALRPN